ncbi:unnamed protein product [Auanema sp. JU1783]|nr:unnamed protein product [Auanema sp. JU1783]
MKKELIRRSLESFVQNLNESQSWRFNDALKNELTNILENGSIYLCVVELMKDQQKAERTLYEDRTRMLVNFQGDPELEQKLLNCDSKIVEAVDELVERQQAVLRGKNVPSFRVTKNTHEIQLQMLIIEFILQLDCFP